MAPEIAAEAPIIGTIAPGWVTRWANAPAAATTSMNATYRQRTKTARERGAKRQQPCQIDADMQEIGMQEGVGEKRPQVGAEAAGKRSAADQIECRNAPG